VKPLALLDDASAQALAFDWLVDAIAPVSVYGERVFDELRPYRPGEERPAQERADRIAAIAANLDGGRLHGARETLRNLPDASGAIARAALGETLVDVGFFELQRFCDAIEHVDALLSGIRGVAPITNAAVRALSQALEAGRTTGGGFYLAGGFDTELERARRRLTQAEGELDAARARELERIARQLGRNDIGVDEFVVMRSDLRGSLPPGVRVLREASTYLLCTLEYDEPTLAALRDRARAADGVAVAEENVRARLSAKVREHAAQLEEAARELGELDVHLAAARFAQCHECSPAAISPEPVLSFVRARFLPLAVELTAAGRAFTPLDLELHDVAVLTGPNMGGKSVCLQTCGFIAICAAFGLPVPAGFARVGLFGEIAWLGIGGEDELGGLLSTFAKEVLRLREIFGRGVPPLLLLVDEFARTTNPHEGKALLVALLDSLRKRGALGMLATHLGGVAREGRARHFAVRGLLGIPRPPATSDLGKALATLAASMDYAIAEVTGDEAPRADAIALTALLGMDGAFVDAAYRALSQ
jgi:DNA mismatch repair protein MutS2